MQHCDLPLLPCACQLFYCAVECGQIGANIHQGQTNLKQRCQQPACYRLQGQQSSAAACQKPLLLAGEHRAAACSYVPVQAPIISVITILSTCITRNRVSVICNRKVHTSTGRPSPVAALHCAIASKTRALYLPQQ